MAQITLGEKATDITGQRFGRLVVILFWGRRAGHLYWLCRCDCGKTKVIMGGHLCANKIRSCRCLNRELAAARETTHGKTATAEFLAWQRMRGRCTNSNYYLFRRYGGRGIKVCNRWQGKTGFANFLKDMGTRPSSAYSLDRINNDGDYEPDNCRWATQKQQARNCGKTLFVTFQGKTKALSEWSEIIGIGYKTLWARISVYHWDPERAFVVPSRKRVKTRA